MLHQGGGFDAPKLGAACSRAESSLLQSLELPERLDHVGELGRGGSQGVDKGGDHVHAESVVGRASEPKQ